MSETITLEPDSFAPPPARSPRRVPAALSLLLLVGLTIGVASVALRHERETAAVETARRVVETTLVRDVLTGRELGTDGIPAAPTAGWGSPEQPIRIRFVPSADQAQAGPTIDDLLDFLRDRTGYAIEGAILRSYGLVVQEIVQGQCEVAFLTAASYARARYATMNNDDPEDDIEAFLSAVRWGSPEYPGSDLAYRGAFIVRTDSEITEISQLDGSRTIAMGNRTSGAGSILPTALLNQLGLEPRIQRFEGYPTIVIAVLQGSVDAGCVWWSPPSQELPTNDGRITVRESVPDVFEKTRVIGYTSWIPNEPVVIRKVVPEGIKRVLARAITLYVGLKALTEEGRRDLHAVGSLVGFIPASNDDFEPLMETIERAFLNDPEGRADFMRGSK